MVLHSKADFGWYVTCIVNVLDWYYLNSLPGRYWAGICLRSYESSWLFDIKTITTSLCISVGQLPGLKS